MLDLATRFLLLWLACWCGSLSPAIAQCTPQWLPSDGYPGVLGQVDAMVRWDPDGAGPAPEGLVLGGSFAVAGDCACNNIVLYTPTTGTWTPLGTGTSGPVHALAKLPNGDLVAGGSFLAAGGVPANYIARWNGASWSAIGAGFDNYVLAVAVLPNGDLVAGGWFSYSGSVATDRLARWNGTSWSEVGGGVRWLGSAPRVHALAVLPNGDLVVGGWFTEAGLVPAVGIARWNGSTWSAIGGGMNSAVVALFVRANGDLIAGGPFGSAGGAAAVGIARWNGSSWSAFGSGLRLSSISLLGQARAFAETPNGQLIAAGDFDLAGGVQVRNIAAWNGASWSALGSGLERSGILTGEAGGAAAVAPLAGGDLVVGGQFVAAGGTGVGNVARWNGASWQTLDRGADLPVRCIAPLPNGDVIVGGRFTTIGGLAANRVARRSGATWSTLGGGLGGEVYGLAARPNGEIFAVGDFRPPGGPSVSIVMRWNGSTWSVPGSGLFGSPSSVVVRSNGDVLVCGSAVLGGSSQQARIWRWDGSSWAPFGTVTDGAVTVLHQNSNGELFAGGTMQLGAGQPRFAVARWTGTAWVGLGSSSNGWAMALTSLPDGSLIAGGIFPSGGGMPAGPVARWDGASWQALAGLPGAPGNAVYALTSFANGDLVAGGQIAAGAGAQSLMRWNGAAWSPLGPALDGSVNAVHLLPNGNLLAGGVFQSAGALVAPYLAELTTPCPATAIDVGGGCGTNSLAATSLPWIGSTFRGAGSGLPSASLVAVVSGFTAVATPLPSILPAGVVGCDLLVSPDLVDVAFATAGTVATATTIPNQPALIGLGFRQQLVPFALDPAGNVIAVTSSNALVMSLGAF